MDNWGEISHKTATEYALTSIKAITVANGGAILILMNFVGKIWAEENANIIIESLKTPFKYYIAGMMCGILIGMTSYVAQSFFTHEKNIIGFIFLSIGVLLAVAGLVFFGYASTQALNAFAI